MKSYREEKIFNIINTSVLTLFTLIVILPFWYVLVSSVTDYNYFAEKGGLVFFPSLKNLSFIYYKFLIFDNNIMLNAYKNTIIYTVTGTAIALLITISTAYGLAQKTLPGRRYISLFFVFTMYFGGGIVPTYVTMKWFGLVNTRQGLILSMCFIVFNTILMRTFFENVPQSFSESAKIDGASDLRILLQIILPLSMPAISTVGLFYAVGYWNDFINSMLYASPLKITTVQKILLDIVSNVGIPTEMTAQSGQQPPSQDGVRKAAIIIVALPMMLIYPFVQKYFEKGINIGGVKG